MILRGKAIGDKYRRCYLFKERATQGNDIKTDPIAVQETSEASSRDVILKKLDEYLDANVSSISNEDDSKKDYKKMYLELVDTLKKVVSSASRHNVKK